MKVRGYKWICGDKTFVWIFEPDYQSPVIITVPHDGIPHYALSGFFKPRINGILGSDNHIWEIVKDILLGFHANAVRGMMPRHLLDYNRSPDGDNLHPGSPRNNETAFEDETMRPFYECYHEAIDRAIRLMIRIYGDQCLLMDFHGFTNQPEGGTEYDIILGTGNRTTVISDIDRKLAAFLRNKGYKVFLPDENASGTQYSGGYTVSYYSREFGIDTILVEVAQKFRLRENKELGIKLSVDFAEFLRLNFAL